jgi:hypothetical protein
MAEESDETSDDWTNALDRIDQAFAQVLDAAERLREEADAGYLDVSEKFRATLLWLTSLTLEHDPQHPDWRRAAESRPRSEPALIRLIDPDRRSAFGAFGPY